MKEYLIFLYLFLCCNFIGLANTPQELFDQANTAFTKGQYQQAIDTYETILSNGDISKEVYFNLGNAYFKNKQLGNAVLNFERALQLAPNDGDISYNLVLIKEQLKDDLDVVRTFFLKQWWQGFHHSLSSSIWSGLTILSLWLGVGGLILWLLASSRTRKKQGFIGGLSLIGLSILFFFAASTQGNFEEKSQMAIILEDSVDLLNGPDEKSTKLLTIHEGLKVELMDQIQNWYKVKLSNGEQGWLQEMVLEEI